MNCGQIATKYTIPQSNNHWLSHMGCNASDISQISSKAHNHSGANKCTAADTWIQRSTKILTSFVNVWTPVVLDSLKFEHRILTLFRIIFDRSVSSIKIPVISQHCAGVHDVPSSNAFWIDPTKTNIVLTASFWIYDLAIMPNTHRLRRRDSTVELSRVGVASASAVCIEFATSSRRLPTKIWKLNMLRIYPVELSRVELCRRCVRARRLSWPSLQFCSVYVTVAKNWKPGHD